MKNNKKFKHILLFIFIGSILPCINAQFGDQTKVDASNSKNFIHVAKEYQSLGAIGLMDSYNPPVKEYIENGDLNTDAEYRTIPAGVTAVYEASQSIRLTSGFVAKEGSTFIARIVENTNNELTITEEVNLNNYGNTLITVYPNPAKDFININLNNRLKDISMLELYNAGGLKMQQLKPTNNIETFDMQPYPQGVYIIKITFDNGENDYHKFIKK